MTACLWSDIDTYLRAALVADMGASSSLYTTLRLGKTNGVDEVTVGPEIDEQHATLPAALIVGQRAQYSLGELGNVLNVTYPYIIAIVASHATYTTLKANLQELARRVRIMLDTRGVFGPLASTDGEQIYDVALGDCEITTWGPVEGSYYGAAEVPFTVMSTVP